MRQPHQPPLPNTTLQIGIAPKTEPLVVVCAYECFGGEKGARDRHQDFAEEAEGIFADR